MLRKTSQKYYMDIGHDEFGSKGPKRGVTQGRTILFLHIQGKGLVYKDVTDAWDTHASLFGDDANNSTILKGRIDTKTKEIMAFYLGNFEGNERKIEALVKPLRKSYSNYTIYVKTYTSGTYLYEENSMLINEAKSAYDALSPAGEALFLWIENDADTYKRQVFPLQKKLVNMAIDGKYNSRNAHKMFEKIVYDIIKKLDKSGEFEDYYKIKEFENDATLVAAAMRDSFEVEANLGNFDNKDFLELRNRGKSAEGLFGNKR